MLQKCHTLSCWGSSQTFNGKMIFDSVAKIRGHFLVTGKWGCATGWGRIFDWVDYNGVVFSIE